MTIPRRAGGLKIRTRITLALTGAGLILFAGYAGVTLRLEEHELRATIEGQMLYVGRGLQVDIKNALRDRQAADVQETLDALDARQPDVDMVVFDLDGRVAARSPGSDPGDRVQRSVLGAALADRRPELRYEPPDRPSRLVLGFPLLDDAGKLLGGLCVTRPLDDMQHELVRLRRNMVLLVVAFVLLTAALGNVLGRRYLSRPLAQVVDGMRALRDGQSAGELPIRAEDEVGAVASEFNAMVAALRDARRRLLEEVEARLRLERGLRRIDKEVTIGRLAAGLAHEIGSPLQVLNGRARALAARPDEPAEVKRNAEILVAQTDRIARIVEQLLRHGRRRAPTRSRVDVAHAARLVLDLVEPEARRRGLRLDFVVDEAAPEALGDVDGIQQVVLNLLTNAMSATPQGGSVTVAVGRGSFSPPGDSRVLRGVSLTVRDTGHGIADDVKERLFEPFFTTRATTGGTGLGLSVVQAIVREHGGVIAVRSEEERGAEFAVTLPTAPDGGGLARSA